eukprot:6479288-Amphidinium_carterae.1
MRALAFQVLSRQAALIYSGLMLPHKRFPIVLFKCLHEPQLGPSLYVQAQKCGCILDPWTCELMHLYPNFEQEEFLAILSTHAALSCVNTVGIEARHSSVRRTLMTRNQTWSMGFADLSAQFLLQQIRRSRVARLRLSSIVSTPVQSRKRRHEVVVALQTFPERNHLEMPSAYPQ